jgi:PTH2 family peptidyl-tRNA hydrolase
MTTGKAAAQAGHAFKLLTRKILLEDPKTADEYFADGMGTNVCLKSKNLHHLNRAYEEAQAAGLPCALIIDSGHIHLPHFDGSPIITALGIGPCLRSDIHHITKRFSSL